MVAPRTLLPIVAAFAAGLILAALGMHIHYKLREPPLAGPDPESSARAMAAGKIISAMTSQAISHSDRWAKKGREGL